MLTEIHLDPVAFEPLEADAEALLVEWQVAPGDMVQAGQEIGVAELVKASVPVTTPVAGRVQALCVPAGQSFGRGAVLARITAA
jgi:biotin carboxyl carrier protein